MFKALHSLKYLHHQYCISHHWYLGSNVVFEVRKAQINVENAVMKNKVKPFETADKLSFMAEFSQDQSQKALVTVTYILNTYWIAHARPHTH